MLAEHVGKTKVDELDVMFLDEVENFFSGGHGKTSRWVGQHACILASFVPIVKLLLNQIDNPIHDGAKALDLHQFNAIKAQVWGNQHIACEPSTDSCVDGIPLLVQMYKLWSIADLDDLLSTSSHTSKLLRNDLPW
jgi:hypothetical protein